VMSRWGATVMMASRTSWNGVFALGWIDSGSAIS
jgi:hypothetical protein